MTICTLTSAAKSQITKLCNENNCYAITLNIKGGGCAGFEYDWGTIDHPKDLKPGDEVIHADGAGRFVIGATSLMYLLGMELDYVKTLVGNNFEIKNPNAKSSCGCGVSVNFDLSTLEHDIH